ncbi:MAG: hypothetical protein KJ739_01130 [Nitrospinae bacterium]|nr:hypothetical protein [Nitrospinota bacterium]
MKDGRLEQTFEYIETFEIRLPLAKEQATGEVTGEVTGEAQKFLKILHTPMSRSEAQIALNLKGQANFRDRYLKSALDLEFVEMTILDKPKSRKQKYRLTDKGKEWVEQNQAEK